MLKTMLIAGAALIALPAMAQDAPHANAPAPATPRSESLPPSDASQTTTPSQSQTSPSSAPAAQDASAPAPAGAPATTASQVAQVVQAEFPNYDKDKSGALSKVEFGDWLGALRKASDASFNPASPEASSWSAQAFTAADTDKNGDVSQSELTAFLSKGKS